MPKRKKTNQIKFIKKYCLQHCWLKLLFVLTCIFWCKRLNQGSSSPGFIIMVVFVSGVLLTLMSMLDHINLQRVWIAELVIVGVGVVLMLLAEIARAGAFQFVAGLGHQLAIALLLAASYAAVTQFLKEGE